MTQLIVGALLFYACLFPYAYFRHDDWLILGNALFHVKDAWGQAWLPTLFYGDMEVVWFFRPLLKLAGLFFYELFHLNYQLWLAALLVIFLATVWLFGKAAEKISGQRITSFIFASLLLGAIHLHLGSVIWMGEGLMNIPQLFFLALNTFTLVQATCANTRAKRVCLEVIALLSFAIALGFKESSVFHSSLLFAWLIKNKSEKPTNSPPFYAFLAPYVPLCAGYLFYRLNLPWNPAYVGIIRWQTILKPVCILAVSFGIILLGAHLQGAKSVLSFVKATTLGFARRWLDFAPFALACAPYLGHGFFSAGWLLLPGCYFCLTVALVLTEQAPVPLTQTRWALCLWVLMVSAVPSALLLTRIGWWDWHKPQQQFVQLLKSAPAEKVQKISVFNCESPTHPSATFVRVVAFDASIEFMWKMFHGTKIRATVYAACDDDPRFLGSVSTAQHLMFRYRFPEITFLEASDKVASNAIASHR